MNNKLTRLSFVLFLLAYCAIKTSPLMAQENPMMYKKIQLSKKNYSFNKLIEIIHQQTGITFSYNASKINGSQKLRIKKSGVRLIDVLHIINKKTGIGYKVINKNFIIYTPPKHHAKHKRRQKRHHRKKRQAVKKVIRKKTAKKQIQPVGATTITAAPVTADSLSSGSDSAGTDTVVVAGDSAMAGGFYAGGGGGGGGSYKLIHLKSKDNATLENPYASLNPPGSDENRPITTNIFHPDISGFLGENILMRTGFTADETYYFNPTLQFGFQFLYAQISYCIGYNSHWRYGLGTEFPLNDRWALRLGYNTGKQFISQSQTYTDSTIVTDPGTAIISLEIGNPLNIQTRLTRYSFSLVRKISANLSVSAGLKFNRLKTNYSPQDPHLNGDVISKPGNKFDTFKAPYVLNETYNANTGTDIKTWMGISISVFYNLTSGKK